MKPFTTDEILTYLTQLALGLEEIHSYGIPHRNISSEHIFMKKGDPDDKKGNEMSVVLGNIGIKAI